ncbi:MAG: hypothetical protein AAF726_20635 [Planctomycetota bacterium]
MRFVLLCLPLAAVAIVFAAGAASSTPPPESPFAPIARVLRHPRCLNCHPSGDRPHVGDDARVHAMNVQRGEDGHGRVGARCTACHRDANQELARVPGAPHWHLAPLSMGWVGLDDHELAEALKDEEKNGGRSLADLREHMAGDPLVLWGWEPGPGRVSIPVSHETFIEQLDAWIEAGAPSPRAGVISTF